MTELGVNLGYKLARINQFRHNHPRDVLQAIIDMLHDFKDEFCSDKSTVVRMLCRALEQADCKAESRKLESGDYSCRSTTTCTGKGDSSNRKRRRNALQDVPDTKKPNMAVSEPEEGFDRFVMLDSVDGFDNWGWGKSTWYSTHCANPCTVTKKPPFTSSKSAPGKENENSGKPNQKKDPCGTPNGKTKGWGHKKKIRNISSQEKKAKWHLHAKIASLDKPFECKNKSLKLQMVLEDETAKIDVIGFYSNHNEFNSVYRKLQVNDWYKMKTVNVDLTKAEYKRQTDHKFEIMINSGTTIVPATAPIS